MPSTKKNILIIDDDRILSKILVNKLTHEGFKVTHEKDGQAGLKRAMSLHPDLIMLDIVMPVMDGLTVLKSLRADSWGKNIPVIILSNLDEAETSASIGGKIEGYLVKTEWSLDDMVKTVRNKLQ